MKRPFGRLVEMVAGLSEEDRNVTMGVLSERWGEPIPRIMDAIDTIKILNGQPSYIGLPEPWEEEPDDTRA